MEFKEFTPYMPRHNILFNVYGQPIDRHPVVIWYNDYEGMYYFVKARSANKKGITRIKFSTEILIPASATNSDSLFSEDSLIDCSQVFQMSKKDFQIAYGSNKTLSVDELPFNYATQIINEIEKNLKNDHISLMNVSIKGFNNQKQPIIEPELLYASEASFNQEKEWYDDLTSDAIKSRIAKFLNTYHQKTNQAAELNSIKDGVYIVNEELRYRIKYPIYHYIYDNELLDKGYSVAEIIDLIKKDIFNTEEFKDYKVSDADVWGSLRLPWGESRAKSNILDEY
ncbi:Mbov_0400 family ICE element protein, partial [Ureaplasma diversum]|uniref:Mbov_0400 family ICE element protein n=1 Tax=Ureaplasma diversum TaxID=42094 RepID=UPI00056FB230